MRCRRCVLSKPFSCNRLNNMSSKCCSIPPSTKRVRNSHRMEKSKPGSLKGRLKAYFQSMRARTASAACRSDRFSTSRRDRYTLYSDHCSVLYIGLGERFFLEKWAERDSEALLLTVIASHLLRMTYLHRNSLR